MEYVNLHLSVLRSPEYLGSTPVQRATWLNLVAYLCQLEDGETLFECRSWGDRAWQQVCAVTLAEVNEECRLWKWIGENLEVNFYPEKQEKQTRAMRKGGRIGNAKRWGKRKHGESPPDNPPESPGVSITKRNVTEANVTEGAPPRIVTLDQAVKWMADLGSGYTADQVREQWLYYDAMRCPDSGEWQKPTRTGAMIRISDWRSELGRALAKFAEGVTGSGVEKNGGGETAAQRVFTLDKRIEELEEQISGFETTQPELAERLEVELKKTRAERKELAAN